MNSKDIPRLLNDIFNCQVCRNRSNLLQVFTEEMWRKLIKEAEANEDHDCLYCLGKLREEMTKRNISFDID